MDDVGDGDGEGDCLGTPSNDAGKGELPVAFSFATFATFAALSKVLDMPPDPGEGGSGGSPLPPDALPPPTGPAEGPAVLLVGGSAAGCGKTAFAIGLVAELRRVSGKRWKEETRPSPRVV